MDTRPLFVPAEPRLSIKEQFRLVEIAHETEDAGIRHCALKILAQSLNPLISEVK